MDLVEIMDMDTEILIWCLVAVVVVKRKRRKKMMDVVAALAAVTETIPVVDAKTVVAVMETPIIIPSLEVLGGYSY